MSELRERKPATKEASIAPPEEVDDKKTKDAPAPPDLEPNIWVLATLFVVFTAVVGSFFFYKVDNAQDGDFATWVNEKFPIVDKLLNSPPGFGDFGAHAQAVPEGLKLTEAELLKFDGSDAEQPIYLAIDGVIFDVSASPAFYGPGGHYHHFVGKDATRAWVTECWDEQDQFTWRLDGVEEMFYPKYLDEQLEDVAQGKWDPSFSMKELPMPKEAMLMLAKKSMERYGSVTDGEKAARRAEDKAEAEKQVQAVIEKWTQFFRGNAKYKAVGEVIFDEDKPAPPKHCVKAMEKQPVKGGKLDGLMAGLNKVGRYETKEGEEEESFPAGMPEHVKEQIRQDRAKKDAAAAAPAAKGEGADATSEEVDLTTEEAGEAKSPHDEL